MCYCRPEISTAVCDNCAPTMYNVIIRLTTLLAERDEEIRVLEDNCMDESNMVVHLQQQLAASQQELETEERRFNVQQDLLHQVSMEKEALQQEVEKLKNTPTLTAREYIKIWDEARKQTARECINIIQTRCNQWIEKHRLDKSWQSIAADEIKSKFGLEG